MSGRGGWFDCREARTAGFAMLAAVIAVLIIFLLSRRAHAADLDYPVSVPAECIAVAQCEGFPTVIESKAQGAKAKARLNSLSPRDRLANECRSAIKAIEAARR